MHPETLPFLLAFCLQGRHKVYGEKSRQRPGTSQLPELTVSRSPLLCTAILRYFPGKLRPGSERSI